MRKLLIVTACLASAVGALAQGTVTFNSTGAQIFYAPGINGGVAVPTTASGGNFTVGLYYGVAGTTDPTTLTLLKTAGISPLAGRFLGGTATTPSSTAAGAAAVFEVRAWSGSALTYELAKADPSAYVGVSGLFNNATGGGGSPPGAPQSLTFANVLVSPVPEPSTIALGLLGLGALLIRRRK